MVIGVFAFGQAMNLAKEKGAISSKTGKVTGVWQGIKDTLSHPISLIRASVVGVVIGIIPGLGINASVNGESK